MHKFGTLRPKWTYNHSVERDTYVHTYTSNWSHTTCQCEARSGLAPIKQISRINDTRYSYIPLQLYKSSAHILYRHLTTFIVATFLLPVSLLTDVPFVDHTLILYIVPGSRPLSVTLVLAPPTILSYCGVTTGGVPRSCL